MFVQCSAPHSFIQKLSQALASLPSTTLILLLLTSLEIDIDLSKKWKISIMEKTIQSLDGFLSNNKIHFTNGEILVNDLISLYK